MENQEIQPERIISGNISAELTVVRGFLAFSTKELGRMVTGNLYKATNPLLTADKVGTLLYNSSNKLVYSLLPSTTEGALLAFYNTNQTTQFLMGSGSSTSFALTGAAVTGGNVYLASNASGYAGLVVESTLYIRANGGTGTVVCSKDVNPAADNTYNLGSATRAWKEIFYYTLTAVSDERKKRNICPCEIGLAQIMQLKAVKYRFKEPKDSYEDEVEDVIFGEKPERKKREKREGGDKIGLIAQEVKKIIPEVVGDHNGNLTIDYLELIPILITAVQELTKEVEKLKKNDTI